MATGEVLVKSKLVVVEKPTTAYKKIENFEQYPSSEMA